MNQQVLDIYNEIKKLINKMANYREGLGTFDMGILNDDYSLTCESIVVDLKPNAYLVSEGLLKGEIDYKEKEPNITDISVNKRLRPGDKYLIAYVNNTPVIIDRLRRGDEIGD